MAREAPHKQQQLAPSLPGAEATFGLPSSSCSFHVSLVLANSTIVQGMTAHFLTRPNNPHLSVFVNPVQ